MPKPLVTILGKAVRSVARVRGGGSALPGLVVEKLDSNFISSILSSLPHGVVLISGTNGKTTTTKMVVKMLEGQGLKVFTNRTGSNFTRGVAAALLESIDISGKLQADIAVLELDEAHAVHFVNTIKPRHSLLLNVMRDQLDRFGEIDHTANLLEKVAKATSESVVVNREDPRLLDVASRLPKDKVAYFGLDSSLKAQFPSDDELRGASSSSSRLPQAMCVLEEFHDHTVVFSIGKRKVTTDLKLEGIYNVFNAVAAVALVSKIIPSSQLNLDTLVSTLATITPAFGRGEKLIINGTSIELVLVKNPSGFRLSLQSFNPDNYATMIAINDNYADGRDMSWLWDVDFESLAPSVSHITGIRAYDMALRMQYDEIEIQTVDTNISSALRSFIKQHPGRPKRIYCTYTAMLQLRRELSKITKVENVL